MDTNVQKTSSEIFIPARTLPVGIYALAYVVAAFNVSSSITTYFQIIPAEVIINLLPLGTSFVTHNYQADLKLDPGLYSYHLDDQPFNDSVSNRSLSQR